MIWKAIVSQTGTNAPTIDQLLINSYPEALTLTRSIAGEYQVNSASSLFTVKTRVTLTAGSVHAALHGYRDAAATCQFHSVNPTTNLHEDGLLAFATVIVETFL